MAINYEYFSEHQGELVLWFFFGAVAWRFGIEAKESNFENKRKYNKFIVTNQYQAKSGPSNHKLHQTLKSNWTKRLFHLCT